MQTRSWVAGKPVAILRQVTSTVSRWDAGRRLCVTGVALVSSHGIYRYDARAFLSDAGCASRMNQDVDPLVPRAQFHQMDTLAMHQGDARLRSIWSKRRYTAAKV